MAKDISTLAELGKKLESAVNQLSELAVYMGQNPMSENFKTTFLHVVSNNFFIPTMRRINFAFLAVRQTYTQLKSHKVF